MDPSVSRHLHSLVRATYADMSPVDRRLADLILNFPGELPGYSASELAGMAQTSNAAVSRFVRRLGFSSYEDMRRQARLELESGAPIFLIGQPGDDSGGDRLERHARTACENITRSLAEIDRTAFEDFVREIVSARTVWIVGFRHGYPVAAYLKWSLAHARPDVRLLPVNGDTFGEHLVDLSDRDVMIVMALRRRVPAIASLVDLAAARGAKTAVVTDPGMIGAEAARWVFRLQSKTSGATDDHGAALVFAHAVTEQALLLLGPAAKERLEAIDEIHDRMDEL